MASSENSDRPRVVSRSIFQYLADELNEEWLNVARNLSITEGELNAIKTFYVGHEKEKIYRMLTFWLSKNGPLATHDILAEALCNVKRNDLAEKVRNVVALPTEYNTFVAHLSTHLTKEAIEKICRYFKLPDLEKSIILKDKSPGLACIERLHSGYIINISDLIGPLKEANLVQAVAMVKEYESNPQIRSSWYTSHHYESTSKGTEVCNPVMASSWISKDGGVIKIGNTGVKLEIPPNAFWNDHEEHRIQIRILPNHIYNDDARCFEDHSTTMVEILPNNLDFKKCVKLTLPHCLIIKDTSKCKVQVLHSHHSEGDKPAWEVIGVSHKISSTACELQLKQFCWIKFTIDNQWVEGKMLFIYTLVEKIKPTENFVTASVGYFPALPEHYNFGIAEDRAFIEAKEGTPYERSIQNGCVIGQWQSFPFLRDPEEPLRISISRDVIPFVNAVTTSPQEISHELVKLSNGIQCPFTFKRERSEGQFPTCHFIVTHQNKEVRLYVNLQRGVTGNLISPQPASGNVQPREEMDTIN